MPHSFGRPSRIPAAERPGVYDIEGNADAGFVKRAMTRYFFTQDYERSIRLHEHLGVPIIKKVVMGTVNRIPIPSSWSRFNYHLGNTGPRLDAVTEFATVGSILNEVLHSAIAVGGVAMNASSIAII